MKTEAGEGTKAKPWKLSARIVCVVNVSPDPVLIPVLSTTDQTPLALNQASALFHPSSAGSLR